MGEKGEGFGFVGRGLRDGTGRRGEPAAISGATRGGGRKTARDFLAELFRFWHFPGSADPLRPRHWLGFRVRRVARCVCFLSYLSPLLLD